MSIFAYGEDLREQQRVFKEAKKRRLQQLKQKEEEPEIDRFDEREFGSSFLLKPSYSIC